MKDDRLIIVVNIFLCATQDELSLCCSIFFIFFLFFSFSFSLLWYIAIAFFLVRRRKSLWENTARLEIRRAAAFFSLSRAIVRQSTRQQEESFPRGRTSVQKGRGYSSEIVKTTLRVTKILIGGRGFIWEASTGESSHTRAKKMIWDPALKVIYCYCYYLMKNK